jgi:hypothetical protein
VAALGSGNAAVGVIKPVNEHATCQGCDRCRWHAALSEARRFPACDRVPHRSQPSFGSLNPWEEICREIPATGLIVSRPLVENDSQFVHPHRQETYRQPPPVCTIDRERCPTCTEFWKN